MIPTLENVKYLSEATGLAPVDSYTLLQNSSSLEEALETCPKSSSFLRKNNIISDGINIYKILYVCSKKKKTIVDFSELDILFGKNNYSLNLENKILLESMNQNQFDDSIKYSVYTYLNKKIIVASKFNKNFRLATKKEKLMYNKEKQKQIKKWIKKEFLH